MRMAEDAVKVRRNDVYCQFVAHLTKPGHTFKVAKAKTFARGDTYVSHDLPESRFTGPQSSNKCNDLPTAYSSLTVSLVPSDSALVNTLFNTSAVEPDE
ncbi:unnamed protein product [Schistocephalus solidus]|uniref:Uncharacterized protein n=1 Tax=Schistocephalus solidus TaxID=70667 RepID=A0A183SSS5_SCHSO|nr:unnamed protein product [Schistocephalus solidus]